MPQEKTPNTLSVWQPVGYSTHVISKQLSQKYKVITAHTGTLDPMAEGVIIVLFGSERYKKFDFAKWKKTYEFEIVFGIETDTYDGLGLITRAEKSPQKISDSEIKKVLESFEGKYTQQVPPYAAITIKGKPLHWYARNNKLSEIKIPQRKGEVFDIRLISLKSVSGETIVNNIINRINLIPGDFRQKEIIGRWENLLETNSGNKNCQIAKIETAVSKGLYVRSLTQDICKKLKTTGFTYKIVRTQNGKYTRKNSKSIKSLNLRPLGNN